MFSVAPPGHYHRHCMKDRVRITEVAPRDGLQNELGRVPTDQKAELIDAVGRFSPAEVEITSFVSPKWIPQLGDAEVLCKVLAGAKPRGVLYSALVPNERGLDRLLATNAAAGTTGGPLIDKVSVFTAASETFSQKNTNASITETVERFRPVVTSAHGAGLGVRGYISCVVACPFEGAIAVDAVVRVARVLADLGVDEIDLGDTIGAATPETIAPVIEGALEAVGDRVRIVLHLHDTRGMAAACVRTALGLGVRDFDGSVAGIGGCPYASTPGNRAPGNIATEVLVRTVEDEGYETGISHGKLAEASALATRILSTAKEALRD